MKKSSKQFLIISFIISYICFGIIVYSRIAFTQIFNSPLYLSLFVLGCLGPLISSFIVHILNRKELGGMRGFIDKFRIVKAPKTFVLIPVFLIAHYGFAILLKNVYRYGSIIDFFRYLPMAIILGSQEIGWRGIIQPGNEQKNGFWKSSIITGLFWSLWFLPLIYIPQFIILPQFYAQFAAYLVGISILLTTLYKSSGSIVYCIILSSFVFALFPVIILRQSFMLVLIALLDSIVANIFKDKTFN
ncbi:CPBP family intramembrane metalloprotease [Clostridium sp. MSJ-11]|uniref:CPBP family intramembrane metalloprotease n=1 Tax=Clostridium mobile TaxID=2841512 RepID=A0ABS6EMS4_9CLOT|nr:CPBP family intramembrane glutamic endopeptidase [Clostridium mobile]MBU5485679.1 CPBP family intramembrane metalloprotease [Clostridium mobile]